MKFHPVAFLTLLVITASSLAQTTAPKKAAPKARAIPPAYQPVTDIPGLPRVLLLGDSISIGYHVAVRERLQGKANVHRPAENCGDSARGVASIEKWLGAGKWDVIHFNFGLHDLKYLDAAGQLAAPDKGKQVASPAIYEANLRKIAARLKQTGAKVIYATTTPVPGGSNGRVEHEEVRYNAVAVRVMRELGIAIDDLHAFVKTRQSQLQRPNNVHFSDEGSKQLADVVVASVTPVLPKPGK